VGAASGFATASGKASARWSRRRCKRQSSWQRLAVKPGFKSIAKRFDSKNSNTFVCCI
jgi:hypothetical protein